ncbi:proteoglycan 4 [Drosophila guanche]|uniref:proteoglycan 4 n=1 Tax=Drosophila guanche TaxID=7266 RepID=UPI0014715AFB|nr:proteoglycan 4 [Drosophila guanche]
MAAVSLSINGDPAVLLEPGTVYRIGSKEEYEFCVADESMELYHALATVYRAGILRVNALLGKVFVNDVENGNADISHKDAIEGKVKLRFGNVNAEVQLIEPLQHHDSSGFGEALKDTSLDTTNDSVVIPETEVQSVNTTADSFFVPETQAVAFDRSTRGGKVSMGDDFMIPETQDLLSTPPAVVHNEASNSNDGSASEMCSQIRICTQDYNEDALEDFDTSMMLGSAVAPLEIFTGFFNQQAGDATDHELSALNWSTSNPKCTALNSTKEGELPARTVACITPEPSEQNPSHDAGNCTPDIFDLMVADGEQPEPENSATPTLCGLKQLVVASIETPTATPLEVEDLIVTQSNANNETNQDFIPTQPFPFPTQLKQRGLPSINSPEEDRSIAEETNEDFIAKQPFPFKLNPDGLPATNAEDFKATQPFPFRKKQKRAHSDEITKDHSDNEEPSQSKQAKVQATDSPADLSCCQNIQQNKENIPVASKETEAKPSTSKDAAALNSIEYDAIMEMLEEMATGPALPPADPNEPQIKFVEPAIIKDDNYNAQVTRMECVFQDKNNPDRWRLPRLPEGARSRLAGSESPPRTTRNPMQRRISDESPRIEPRKRPAITDQFAEPRRKISRPSRSLLVEEEAKGAASKESTPELVAKKRSNSSKTTTSTELDSASISKAKKASKPKRDEDFVVPIEPRRRPRNSKTKSVKKIQEEAAGHGNTSEEEEVAREASRPQRRLRTKQITKQEEATGQAKSSAEVKGKGTKQKEATGQAKASAEVKGKGSKQEEATGQANTSVDVKPKRTKQKEATGQSNASDEVKGKGSKKEEATGQANTSVDVKPKRTKQKEATGQSNASDEVKGKRSKKEEATGQVNTSVDVKPKRTKQKEATGQSNASDEVKGKGSKKEPQAEQANTSAAVKGRMGRARKSQTPTPTLLDTTDSKITKEKPPEKEKRGVGRLRKSETPTEEKPIKPKVKRSKTPPTTKRMTRRNTAKEEPEEEPQAKVAAVRELVVRIKNEKLIKSNSSIEEAIDGPTTSNASAQQKETSRKEARNRSSISSDKNVSLSQENALKAINQHVRKEKGKGKIKIAFSACNSLDVSSVLKALKHCVEKTADPLSCDVLIMDRGDRTYKFLVAVAANKPILSSSWLQSMRATSRVTVLAEHLFADSHFEKMYKFDPLMAMQQPQLLSGFHFMLCEGILPNPNEMKAIIESAGGKVHKEPPAQEQKLYVVAVAKDKQRYVRRLRNHAHVQYINTEGIMQSLVQHNRQRLDDPKVQI